MYVLIITLDLGYIAHTLTSQITVVVCINAQVKDGITFDIARSIGRIINVALSNKPKAENNSLQINTALEIYSFKFDVKFDVFK